MMDLQTEKAVEEIRKRGAVVVGLQMPEGLKVRAREMARELEEATGCEVVIVGDPCYGACDLRSFEGMDLLVHVGHAPIPDLTPKVPTVFLEVRMDFDVRTGLQGAMDRIASKVGLVATAQHLHLLPSIEKMLTENGREVHIGKGDARTASPGQVLGCNVSSAHAVEGSVEQFIFIGSGYFHPLAVALGTGRPVLCLDPYRGMVDDLQEMRDKVLRQRYAAMAKAQEAKDWLVLVCDRSGQRRMTLARKCRDMLRERGMKAEVLLLNEVRAEALLPYRAEAAVSTACPRLAIDDGPHYPIPLLTPWELEMVLGVRKMDDYRLDQILEGDTPC
ncbi:MAG TPA: diphthamide biosynthesis enzyme Dph2 [Methanomassiliicoccales archaeon]|nr:diphthamide biosynthesis enzyme Dph2 [Methanomassiliicoccales archaeon]